MKSKTTLLGVLVVAAGLSVAGLIMAADPTYTRGPVLIPADGSVSTGKLADNAVTEPKIAADAVGASEIAAGAVGTSELADSGVAPADLQAASTYTVGGIVANGTVEAKGAGVKFPDGTTQATAAPASGWSDDGANVRLITAGDLVGIGTASPATQLEISGIAGERLRLTQTTAGGSQFFRFSPSSAIIGVESSAGDGVFGSGSASALSIGQQGNNGIAFHTNNITAPRLFITGGGDVGLGTISPGTKLDVGGTAQFGTTAKSTFSTSGALTLAANASLTLSGASGNVTTGSSVTANAFFGNGAALTNLPVTASGWTDDGTVVRLTTQSDAVGIGTLTPNPGNGGMKLHVVGQVLVSTAVGVGILPAANNLQVTDSLGSGLGTIGVEMGAGSQWLEAQAAAAFVGHTFPQSANYNISKSVTRANIAPTPIITIEGFSSQTGIGTSSPLAILHVAVPGAGGVTPLIVSTGTAASTEALRVSSTALVGIGVTTPASKLHLSSLGDTFLTIQPGTLGTEARLDLFSFDGGKVWSIGKRTGSSSPADAFVIDFTSGGARAMLITAEATPKIGVGTNSPAERFHVTATIRADTSYKIGANVAFSSVPVHVAGGALTANLTSGVTFYAFTLPSAITLRTISTVVQVAGVGGSGDTIRCNDSAGTGIEVTIGAAAAAGTVTENLTSSANIAANARVNCHVESGAATKPNASIALGYVMQ